MVYLTTPKSNISQGESGSISKIIEEESHVSGSNRLGTNESGVGGTDRSHYTGTGTDGTGTDGMGTDGMGTDGMGTDGMGTDGMGTDGMGTDGMGTARSHATNKDTSRASKQDTSRASKQDTPRGNPYESYTDRMANGESSINESHLDIPQSSARLTDQGGNPNPGSPGKFDMLSRDFLSSGAQTHKNFNGQRSVHSGRISKDSLVVNPVKAKSSEKEESDQDDE
jgi:pentapeptide MXKDX repeat protein